MDYVRLPFSFYEPPNAHVPPPTNASSRRFSTASTVALSLVVGAFSAGATITISKNSKNPFFQNALNYLVSNGSRVASMWGSLCRVIRPLSVNQGLEFHFQLFWEILCAFSELD